MLWGWMGKSCFPQLTPKTHGLDTKCFTSLFLFCPIIGRKLSVLLLCFFFNQLPVWMCNVVLFQRSYHTLTGWIQSVLLPCSCTTHWQVRYFTSLLSEGGYMTPFQPSLSEKPQFIQDVPVTSVFLLNISQKKIYYHLMYQSLYI